MIKFSEPSTLAQFCEKLLAVWLGSVRQQSAISKTEPKFIRKLRKSVNPRKSNNCQCYGIHFYPFVVEIRDGGNKFLLPKKEIAELLVERDTIDPPVRFVIAFDPPPFVSKRSARPRAKRAVRSKQKSERCERTSERMIHSISYHSCPMCIDAFYARKSTNTFHSNEHHGSM